MLVVAAGAHIAAEVLHEVVLQVHTADDDRGFAALSNDIHVVTFLQFAAGFACPLAGDETDTTGAIHFHGQLVHALAYAMVVANTCQGDTAHGVGNQEGIVLLTHRVHLIRRREDEPWRNGERTAIVVIGDIHGSGEPNSLPNIGFQFGICPLLRIVDGNCGLRKPRESYRAKSDDDTEYVSHVFLSYM